MIMTVSPVIRQRRIPIDVKVFLFVNAGGRCEFDGCNKYLLRHHLTKTEGNYADMAHIVGFSKGGPRGGHASRPEDIHEPRNLMLVCRDCHKLIDDAPETYSVTTLKEYNRGIETPRAGRGSERVFPSITNSDFSGLERIGRKSH